MHRFVAIASSASLLSVTVLGSPYSPTWINDPEAEIDCLAEGYECQAEQGKDSCKGYPDRICVPTCYHLRTLGKPEINCYHGCQIDKKTGEKPDAACMHKSLYPMLPQDTLALFVLLIVAVAAGASGIGGGGLNVPILMIISNFNIKEAVPLSHAAVMGNAIGQMILNCPQKHPSNPARPLIHYEIAYLLLPAMLGGNSLGVVVGRVMPATLLVVLALGVIFLAATKSAMKGIHVRKECLVHLKARNVSTAPQNSISLEDRRQLPGGGTAAIGLVDPAEHAREGGSNSVAREQTRIPWNVIFMMVVFNIFVLFDVMLQSKDVFHTVRCSGLYWGALVGLYPFIIAALWLGLGSLERLTEFHRQRGEFVVEGEPTVTVSMAIGYASATSLVGLLAGILGLGGGEFLVPLLLEFGLHPRVASATSGFLMVFGTSNNILHYLIAGTLQPILGYAVALSILAFIGAVVGLILRDTEYVKARSYLIVFTVASLLYISMVLLVYRGLIEDQISWAFGSFC
jgi:uncharacterized membrane protein YfcA